MPEPRDDDTDPWEDLLTDLGGDEWAAADARAAKAERRRRRSGHALLLFGVVAVAVGLWFARPAEWLRDADPADSQDASLVLVATLSDDAFWEAERLSPRARALPGLAVLALSQAHRREPSAILEQPLMRACERLAAESSAAGVGELDGLAALLHGLALLEAGRALDDVALETLGRERLTRALDDEVTSFADGRLALWRQLAQDSLSAPRDTPPRLALAEALGGPAGEDPAWRAAREILLQRR